MKRIVVYPYSVWLHSQLSVARYFGGISIEGHKFVIDYQTKALVDTEWMKVYKKGGTDKANALAERYIDPKKAIKVLNVEVRIKRHKSE